MDFNDRAIQQNGFDLDTDNLSRLQFLEDAPQHALFRPATQPRVNRVPVAEALRQATPLASVFCNIEDGVEHLQIGEAHISTLSRQALFDLSILSRRDFHDSSIQQNITLKRSPSTVSAKWTVDEHAAPKSCCALPNRTLTIGGNQRSRSNISILAVMSFTKNPKG